MSEQLDYIIVGQGIAGSMVAHFLLQKGKKILVIDQYNPTSSSNIAAGVVNPVTGRKMVKTWMIDDLLPFAKKHTAHWKSNCRFLFSMKMISTKFFHLQKILKTGT
jgi:glycine/D-amino acid oxidase-like deaminating enzyme